MGPFVVDLAEGPLAQAGLFAITGPTGAGKSTILDALCLALYNNTPRLRRQSRVRVGPESAEPSNRLTGSDVRGLLSHGSVEGFAEAEFEGCDHRLYRARWQIRRARGKPDGRVQSPRLTLFDVAGEHCVGDTTTEVKEAIVARVGLSFDQFCRSSLLAQGDFAAFLHARDSERSELLERMTGTEIYGALSRNAHLRHSAEVQRLAALEARLEGVQVLSDPERQQVDEAVARSGGDLVRAKSLFNKAFQRVSWEQERARCAAEVDEAQLRLEGHEAERESVATTRARLSLADVASRFRATWQELQQVELALPELTGELEDLVVRNNRLEQELATVRAQERQATTLVDEAQTQKAKWSPVLREVRTLEATSDSMNTQLDEAVKRHHALQQREEVLQNKRQQWVVQDQAAHEQLAACEGWLSAHPDACLIHQGLSVLEVVVPKLNETAEALKAAQNSLASCETSRLACEADLARCVEEADTATRVLNRLQAVQPLHDHTEMDQVGQAVVRLTRHLLDLERLQRSTDDLLRCQRAMADAGTEVRTLRLDLGAFEAQIRHLEHSRSLLASRWEEVDATTTLVLATLRDHLQSGDPCPLCGTAGDHPFVENPPDEPALAVLKQRKQALTTQLGSLDQQLLDARVSHQSAGDALVQVEETLRQQTTLADGLVREWEASARLEPLMPLNPKHAAGLLKQRLRRTRTHLRALERTHRAMERREQAQRSHARAIEANKSRVAQARSGLEGAQRELARNHDHHQVLQQQQATLAQTLEAHRQSVAEIVRTPDGVELAWLREQAAMVEHHQQCRAEAQAQIAQSVPALARIEASHVEVAKQIKDLEAEERRLQALAREGRQRRDALQVPEGLCLSAIEGRLEDATAHLSQCRERRVMLHTTQQGNAERLQALRSRLAEGRRKKKNLRAKLQRRARTEEVDLATLKPLLLMDPGQLSADLRRLQRLDEQHAKAKAVCTERRDRLQRVIQREPPAVPAQPDLAALEEEVARLQREVGALRGQQQADDEAAERSSTLRSQTTDQQAVVHHWALMNELIGSHDGKKLRVFAQSLTLDGVIAEANHHLRGLAPRYRLMRVPGYDLDLQVVDHDMADQIRATETLSGGESFLVSLALALGLASLSGANTTVGTLFIDEGFGSLDPDALEMALYTLDQLRSEGRQVGIISHVEGLAARIGAQVQVHPQGGGCSTIEVIAA